MISDPARWVKDLAQSGANQMTFHYECAIRITFRRNILYISRHEGTLQADQRAQNVGWNCHQAKDRT